MKTTVISGIAILLSLISLSLFIKKDFIDKEQVFYCDNANIRAMFQSQIQKDILNSTITDEKVITTQIVNFDKDLEITLTELTKDYNIDIHSTRAFYSSKESFDLTPKVLEILESKGYKLK
jgi:hypothetical protein